MKRGIDAYWRSFQVVVLAAALSAVTSPSANSSTVAEKRVAALEPCSGLKQNFLGAVIGVDKLESVKLDRADVEMLGDEVTISFEGGLACRTSDSATVKGSAAVEVVGSAVVNLVDCSVPTLLIEPVRFGGTFGPALEALWGPLIRPKLESEARSMLVDACGDFVGDR